MAEIGIAMITALTNPPMKRVLVMEGLSTGDRPLAVGYVIMDMIRLAYMRTNRVPEISVKMGTVSTADLAATCTGS